MAEEPARRSIRFTCSRRQFWRALLQEVVVSYDSVMGCEGVRLSELGHLPDEALARLRPVVNPDCRITIQAGQVCARSKEKEEAVPLFPAAQENLTAFNLFDGRHTLAEAGRLVAAQMDWEESKAFAHARDLFLSLVARLVCVPGNPPSR